MPPETQSVVYLHQALQAALVQLHPSATLLQVSAKKLAHYLHELSFAAKASDLRGVGQSAEFAALGWVAQAPDGQGMVRSRRHYLVAEVDLGKTSVWFPAILGTVAKLRSHLGPDEQADLVVLLVAQPGTNSPGRVAVLERNEAFAQVLVWSPGVDSRHWRAEADRFVRRLRLGPIEGPSGVTTGDLSPVDAVFEGTSTSGEVRANWRRILMNTGIGAGERARHLLAAVDVPDGVPDDE